MSLVIVSWNIQGKWTAKQLIGIFRENKWDILIVLEPQNDQSTPSDIDVLTKRIDVGGEDIVIIYRGSTLLNVTINNLGILIGYRHAALISITSVGGINYSIVGFHAPYEKNDGTASAYVSEAINLCQSRGIDLIIGDFNTYYDGIGRRVKYKNLTKGMKTSSGDYPLDKALLSTTNQFQNEESIKARIIEREDIKFPTTLLSETNPGIIDQGRSVRVSTKANTLATKVGSKKNPDHRAVRVELPSQQIIKSQLKRSLDFENVDEEVFTKSVVGEHGSTSFKQSDKKNFSKRGKKLPKIGGDGHCLYRCIAHIEYGDQELYQRVRDEIAEHGRLFWFDYPALQNLKILNTLRRYLNGIKRNMWGGETEIAMAADCYELCLRLVSPQAYGQATYNPFGSGPHTIYHINNNHFQLNSG